MPSDLLGAHLDWWTDEDERTVCLATQYLSRFQYKPNWQFSIVRKPELSFRVQLLIEVMVTNSRPPFQPIPIAGLYPVPQQLATLQEPERMFFDLLHHSIKNVEIHECNEWFRVDGRLPYDPHKEGWTR